MKTSCSQYDERRGGRSGGKFFVGNSTAAGRWRCFRLRRGRRARVARRHVAAAPELAGPVAYTEKASGQPRMVLNAATQPTRAGSAAPRADSSFCRSGCQRSSTTAIASLRSAIQPAIVLASTSASRSSRKVTLGSRKPTTPTGPCTQVAQRRDRLGDARRRPALVERRQQHAEGEADEQREADDARHQPGGSLVVARRGRRKREQRRDEDRSESDRQRRRRSGEPEDAGKQCRHTGEHERPRQAQHVGRDRELAAVQSRLRRGTF